VPTEVRQQQERSFDLEQALSSALRESSVIATMSVSPQGEIVSANESMLKALRMGSMANLISKDFKTDILLDPGEWDVWESVMASGRTTNVEISFRDNEGQNVFLKGDIRLITDPAYDASQLFGFFADVTTSKQMESALQRTARLEAVGSLTSGIAHDFNNLLTVLVGNLYLVAEGVRENPSLFDKVKRARDAAMRGADLTRQLLSFARNEQPDSGVLDPNALIENLEPLLGRAVGSQITLKTAIEPGVAPINGNAAQLESVIVNLTVNARDAIDGAGDIVIKASNVSIDASESHRRGLEAGEYVSISVTDDGPGVPEALRDQVFEPFFSTKRDGEGTGLGLSMVRRFAEQAGGTVDLTSPPGLGTTVTLLLPRSEQTSADSAIKTMPLSTLPAGDESVLVLAEDEDIRSTIQQILEVLGYTVQFSSGPEESFEILKTEAIDLVLIDSTAAADIDIGQLLKTVRGLKSSIQTIVINDTGSRPLGEELESDQLIKPFSLLELATAVRRALDGVTNE